ncbi:MAG: 3-phosphoshikimate 1-carboxyvinyltransferase [Betaproteobacteria bacterium]
MKSLVVGPYRRAAGALGLPGSKSISNRVLLLAALAKGKTIVRGLLDADDTRVMVEALQKLGIMVDNRDLARVVVPGKGGRLSKRKDLFLGNAGTAFRPLTAVLAFSAGRYRLMGVPRMHERPIGDLVEALRAAGAKIGYLGSEGFPPLLIEPAKIDASKPIRIRGDISSQYLSALLMAMPLAVRSGEVGVIEVEGELISKPYVEITINLMRKFGIDVGRQGWKRFELSNAKYRSPGEILVEGDASSASYFLAAGAIAGGPVRVRGVGRGSIQGDVRFVEVLEKMGARVALGEDWIEVSGGGRLRAFDLDLNHIPDAAMTAAVAALFADGPCAIRNIASWRVKETDRIAAMATELRKLGAKVEEGADYLKVVPGTLKAGAAIDTYDDHRMAMCFSLAALGGMAVTINDPDCVGKTFPDYFERLASIAS